MMMDASGRLAGRGAYLCDDPTCRGTALDKNILTRALHVPLPDDLRDALAVGKTPERSTDSRAKARGGPGHGLMSEAQIPEHTNTPGGTIGQE